MTQDLETYRERQLTRLREAGALSAFESGPSELLTALGSVVTASDFVCESLARDVELAKWLIQEGQLDRTLTTADMAQRLGAAVLGCEDVAAFIAAMRRQRTREMVRIAWRDLAGVATVQEVLSETSAFADAAIEAAVGIATHDLEHTYGTPRNASGETQSLVVLGMGKLGGGELNFSSDIDLIFVFPEKGETSGARSMS